MNKLLGFHIPGYAGKVHSVRVGESELVLPELTGDEVRRATERVLRKGGSILPSYSVDQLTEIFGRVARVWLEDEEQRRNIALVLSELTGMSPEVVSRSLAVEQGNSAAEDIRAALDRDLGNRKCLDGFVRDENLQGMTRAFGPRLTGAILTANVPGLSYLPMVRSLCVKSPIAAKLSSGEPVFGPAWVRSLGEVEPPLAECVALFHWKGGNRELEQAMLQDADVLMVYGGPDTIHHFRETYGAEKILIEHGHKVGIALVGRECLTQEKAEGLARKTALDLVTFDQRACISPQILYAEQGGEVSTGEFARMIGSALKGLEKEHPPARIDLDAAATLAQERIASTFQAALQGGGFSAVGENHLVVHEQEPRFQGVIPARFLRVFPVDRLEHVLGIIQEHGEVLQNAGLAVSEERLLPLAEGLSQAGVSHITSLGLMHRPTMRWKHDGHSTYAAMVRWTDIEHPEGGAGDVRD